MINLAQNLLGFENDALSRFGQSHFPLCSIKQPDAEFSLELAYLLAEWWLADMQSNCRTAEIQLFGNGHQVS
jgi:hypothetical protein